MQVREPEEALMISYALLQVGIRTNEQGEQVATSALAYAAHEALSPVRYLPTVALSRMVANVFGWKVESLIGSEGILVDLGWPGWPAKGLIDEPEPAVSLLWFL